jgi:hypothetical protein
MWLAILLFYWSVQTMADEPVSFKRIVIPSTALGAIAIVIAGAVYGYDNIMDRLLLLEVNAAFHVKLDDLEERIKQIDLKRVHDKIAVIQSALNFYNAKRPLNAAGLATYASKQAEMDVAMCELERINLPTSNCGE